LKNKIQQHQQSQICPHTVTHRIAYNLCYS